MLRSFALTDVGMKRQINQDYVFASAKPVGNLPNLFIVADGMGGHNAGDYASRRSTEIIVESIGKNDQKSPVKVIREAIEEANAHVHEEASQKDEFYGMGTTCVVATIIDDILYVANVGDSRLYLIDTDITQITKDHSLVEEMIRVGQIDRDRARNHPDKNIITRAVGVMRQIKVDFFDVHVKTGDLILMCSDGLSNMVEDEVIKNTILSAPDVEEKADRLVRLANENGGKDNIAVIVIEPFAQ